MLVLALCTCTCYYSDTIISNKYPSPRAVCVGQRRSANKCDKRKVSKNLSGSHILFMSSFQQPLPPPPPPRPCASSDESPDTNPKDRITCGFVTTEAPRSSCCGRYDEMGAAAHQKDQKELEVTPPGNQGFRLPLRPTLLMTVLASASFFVAIVLLLSIGKAIVFVNVLGFAFPALATVHGMVCSTDTSTSRETKTKTKIERRGRGGDADWGGDADLSSAYAGYWVLFGMFSAFDSILPVLTPFYFGVKACVLAWGASSARPYGGRRFLRRLFLAIEGDDDSNENTIGVKTTMIIQVLVERTCRLTGLPIKASRLAWTTAAFAAGTVALGACSWSVLIAEVWFSKLSRWIQDGVCVLAGASWPLWATSIALGRADAARLERGSGGGGSDNHQRQGPAAIQWLSYWSLFGFLEVFVDPVAGAIPHYYSIKLFMIATLALPQTRGAYLIASHVLGDRDKNFDDPVMATK